MEPRIGGGRRRRIHRIASVCLAIFLLVSTAQAARQTLDEKSQNNVRPREGEANEEDSESSAPCTNADGTACSTSTSPTVVFHNTQLEVIPLTQSYTYPGAGDYGDEVKHHLDTILKSQSIKLDLEELYKQRPSEDRNNKVRDKVFLINDELLQVLLSLARIHKGEWLKSMEVSSSESESEQVTLKRLERTYDHFIKAENAYEAALDVCRQLWFIMQRGVLGSKIPVFSLLERMAISELQMDTHRFLADLYRTRHDFQGGDVGDDLSIVHRNLKVAENWNRQTLQELGIDLIGKHTEWVVTTDQGEAHEHMVKEAIKASALINQILGTFLVEMYEKNLGLDTDKELKGEPPTSAPQAGEFEGVEDGTYLGKAQKRILSDAAFHLKNVLKLYDTLTPYGDYRRETADSSYFLALVYSYLFQWSEASRYLERSLFLYDSIALETIQGTQDSMDLAFSAVHSTQSLWEACLNLPGRTEFAKEIYYRHLRYHRYVETKTKALIDSPLTNDGEEEGNMNTDENQIVYRSQSGDLPFEEDLVIYHGLLNKYRQHEITLRTDYTSYPQNDLVFEGRLRSAIGALHLSQNQKQSAKIELVLAVGNFREGLVRGHDHFKAYNEKGEIIEYPTQLELANALVNLAFTLLQFKMWRTSYACFEEAMDIYGMLLGEDESPMNNRGLGVTGKRKGHPQMWHKYIKEEAKVSIWSQYLNVIDLPVMDNVTETEPHRLDFSHRQESRKATMQGES